VLAQHWYAVPVFQGILTLFVLVNFSMATFMDPGVIPRASPDEDRDDDFRAPLYRNVEINGITVRLCFSLSIVINRYSLIEQTCPKV
jgi:palmitoyltransferase ZDHHC5/8